MESSELPPNLRPRPIGKVSEFMAPSDPDLSELDNLTPTAFSIFVTLAMLNAQIFANTACKRIFVGGITWIKVFKNVRSKICGKTAFTKSEVILSA